MPSTPRVVQALAGPDADEHADRAGTHQMQGGLVGGAPTDDDGNVELADEPLEVEGLAGLGHVLGGHHRALDDEQVELGLEQGGAYLAVRCGVRDGARHDAGVLDLPDPPADQLGLDRLLVDLLHPGRGLVGLQPGDLLEQRLGVLVTGPEALRG